MFDTLGRCVANMWRSEVALDLLRPALRAPEEAPHVAHQFKLSAGAPAADGVGLEVLVKQLIGIELGAVARQEEEPDMPLPALHPAGDSPGEMDRVTVRDHEDLPASLPSQALKEDDEDASREPSLEDHERQLASVGDGRHPVAAEASTGTRHHGRLAPATEAAPGLVVRAHPRLVAPVNLGPFSTSQRPDGRILPAQPPPHRQRVLFVGPSQGFLRREAPAGQIPPHRPDRQVHPEAPRDEILHGFAGPEHERQLELIWAAIGQQARHGRGLVGFQRQDLRSASWASTQGPESPIALAPVPPIDRLPRNAEHPRRFGLRHAGPHHSDDAKPKARLSLGRQVANIGWPHASESAREYRICQTFML